MSNTQFIFINKDKIPTKHELQNSIDKLGYNFQLDPEFKPFDDEGFSPCTLNADSDVGFEIFYQPSTEICGTDEQLKKIAVTKDYCINLNWGGSIQDFACVMIVSTALAKYHQAIVSYEGEEPDSIDKLVNATKGIVSEAHNPSEKIIPKRITDQEETKQLLLSELNSTIGKTIKISTSFNWGSQIVAMTTNKYHFRASVFKVSINKNTINVLYYGKVTSEMTRKLYDLSEEPSKIELEELETLSIKKDNALDKDEKAISQIQDKLASITKEQVIKRVKWDGNGRLNLYCTNLIIGLVSIDDYSLGNIVLTTPKYQFEISQNNVSVREI